VSPSFSNSAAVFLSNLRDMLVARVVHFLRLHLVGKTIKKVDAPEDAIIFGKVGTTGPEVVAALTGKKVWPSPSCSCLSPAPLT